MRKFLVWVWERITGLLGAEEFQSVVDEIEEWDAGTARSREEARSRFIPEAGRDKYLKERYESDGDVRCPSCGDIEDLNGRLENMWSEGDYDVACRRCDYAYKVDVEGTLVFYSQGPDCLECENRPDECYCN